MNSTRWTSVIALVVVMATMPVSGWGLTPDALEALINSDKKPTLIDIRDAAAYQKGHIPGAINIAGRLIPGKTFPPIGPVVVYDDGLDEAPVQAAVDALNRKAGITAEMLEGGFLGWEAGNRMTTGAKGMREEEIPLVTYQQLSAMVASNPAVVLVDLRRQGDSTASALSIDGASPAGAALTDLTTAFPGARIAGSPFNSSSGPTRSTMGQTGPATGSDKLYVLIDNGDGTAETLARRMKASGRKRFVILIGGEMALKRKGKPGLNTK